MRYSSAQELSSNDNQLPPKALTYEEILVELVKTKTENSQLKEELRQLNEAFIQLKMEQGPEEKSLDIAILHSGALAIQESDGTIRPFTHQQTLSPQPTFDKIIKSFEEKEREYLVYQSHLNRVTFQQMLNRDPKILVIDCHGELADTNTIKGKTTCFLFEDVKQPALVDHFTEENLSKLLNKSRLQNVRLAIVSACYSGDLADILVKAGVKSVVSILTQYQVQEKSASEFNVQFLRYIVEGKTIKFAFDEALKSIEQEKFNWCCCQHDHTEDCLWDKLRKKDPIQAHELHTKQCNCYNYKNTQGNKHVPNCKAYKNFYDKLLAGPLGEDTKRKEKDFEKKFGVNGFLQKPLTEGIQRNYMCCCKSNAVHSESQKFQLMPIDGSHDEKIELTTIQGKLVRHKSDTSQLKNDQRYLEHKGWLKFAEEHRYQFERNFEVSEIVDFIFSENLQLMCIEGPNQCGKSLLIPKAIQFSIVRKPQLSLYYVSLEGVELITTAIVKISEALRDNNRQPTEASIMDRLADEECLIYFGKCEYLENSQSEVFKLFKKLISKNSLVKIIVGVIELQDEISKEMLGKNKKLKIEELTAELKFAYFKSQIFLLGKNKKKEFKIDLSEVRQKLTELTEFDELNLYYVEQAAKRIKQTSDFQKIVEEVLDEQKKQEDTRQNKFITLLSQMVSKDYFIKNMIFLLTFTPGGLTVNEVRQLCEIHKEWFGDYSAVEIAFENFKVTDEAKQSEAYMKLVVIEYKMSIEGKGLSLIKINPDATQTIQKHWHSLKSLQIQDGEREVDRQELIPLLIQYMSSKALQILRQIVTENKHRSQSDQHYRLITAHLDCDMWQLQSNEDKSFNVEIKVPEERMSKYLASNFQHLIDESFLNQHIQGWGQNMHDTIKQPISDLCLSVPSILIELKRYQEAQELIIRCQKFADKLGPLLRAKLKLMHASILTFTSKNPCEEIEKLLGAALIELQETGGEAETYFVQAMQETNKLAYEINSEQNGTPFNQSNYSDLTLKRELSLTQKLSWQSQQQLKSLVSNLSKGKLTQLEVSCEEIKKLFEKSLELFRKVKSSKTCSQVCGTAKVLFAETLFFVTFSSEIIQPSQEVLKLYLRKAADMEQLFLEKADYNYVAQSICLQAKVQLMTSENQSQLSRAKVLEARSTLQRAFEIIKDIGDEEVKSDLGETQARILNAIRNSSSNLFTFAKSFPLVGDNSKLGSAIGDYAVSNFQLAPKIRKHFQDKKAEVQVNFDFLNEELLKNVAQYGTKILHLTSDQYHPDFLVLEGQNGLLQPLRWNEIETYFEEIFEQENTEKRLKIECVVLAIPQSSKLGEQFEKLGVNNVVTFDLKGDFDQNLHQYRYNYIYSFCAHFYKRLVDEFTVIDAFNDAKDYVSNHKNLDLEIWELKETQHHNLGIEPVLLGGDNLTIHNRKLFDTKAQPGDPKFLGSGDLQEIFKTRCLNTNIEKPKDAFIGHHQEMYKALIHLTCTDERSDDFRHLFHVQGRHFVGKTRFLQEVAYRLLQRGFFQFKIQYRDMKKEPKFSDLVRDLRDQYNSHKSNKPKAIPILIVLDNIDCLLSEEKQDYERNINMLINLNPGIRFLTSSTRDWTFKQLKSERYTKNDQKLGRFDKIWLQPLTEIQTVNLLLSKCQREITRKELEMTEEDNQTVQKRLQLEVAVQKCINLPGYIDQLAKQLSEMEFNEIEVEVQSLTGKAEYRRKQSPEDISSQGQLLFEVDRPKDKTVRRQKSHADTGQENRAQTREVDGQKPEYTEIGAKDHNQNLQFYTESEIRLAQELQEKLERSLRIGKQNSQGPRLSKKASQQTLQSSRYDQEEEHYFDEEEQ